MTIGRSDELFVAIIISRVERKLKRTLMTVIWSKNEINYTNKKIIISIIIQILKVTNTKQSQHYLTEEHNGIRNRRKCCGTILRISHTVSSEVFHCLACLTNTHKILAVSTLTMELSPGAFNSSDDVRNAVQTISKCYRLGIRCIEEHCSCVL